MLERIAYNPPKLPTNEEAHKYVPKFLYRDSNNAPEVTISDDFYGTRRRLRIGILGAGLTCLNFLHFLEEKIPAESIDVVVYDKNEDVGGVWCSNRYPGCRADISGVGYQFSWRPQIWSQFYPPAAEIQAYMKDAALERDFYKYMHFRHEIVKASWTDEEAKWSLGVRDCETGKTFEDKVDLFLEFNGPLSNPQINVPGINDFKGRILHPGKWDPAIDLRDKKIALIGYGSTGIQIAPYLVKDASKFYTWHRNKNFVNPPPTPQFAGKDGANFAYSEEQKKLLQDPDVYLAYWKTLDDISYATLPSFVNGSPIAAMGKKLVTQYMKEKLATHPEIFEHIIPSDFDIGCRRPTFSYGYLEAITHPKSTFLLQPPRRFTETGFEDSEGNSHSIDIVVAATGYDQTHLPQYPKTVNGVDMRKQWENLKSPPSYMAMGLLGMPNYFNPSSAFAPLQASYFLVSEPMTRHIVKAIDKIQLDHIKSITPKKRAVEHFIRHCNAYSERVVQGGPCSAWYKSTASGKPALWPGGRTHFLKLLDNPRFEDYEIRYADDDNMFAFMGNGWDLEIDGNPNADRTWYLGQPKKQVDEETIEKLRGIHGTTLPSANIYPASDNVPKL